MKAASAFPDGAPQESARERGIREREELKTRLYREGAFSLAQKLEPCGKPFGIRCVSCGDGRMVETACRRRWCPACAWLVARERVEKYRNAAGRMAWPLFVTLTMPNTDSPEGIRTIRDAWAKMRRRKLIVDRVKGGIVTVECTNTGKGWHPHLHALIDCEWLAIHTPPPTRRDSAAVVRQKCDHARLELSAVWSDVLKVNQSIVLAIRKEPGHCINYALKYAVKAADLIACQEPIAPLIEVIQKSRMLSTFGTLREKGLDDEEEEKPCACCRNCGAVDSIVPESVIDAGRREAHDKRNAIR